MDCSRITHPAQDGSDFMRISFDVRLMIYAFAVDPSTPRRVLTSHGRDLQTADLTISEQFQHAASVLRRANPKNDRNYILHEFTKEQRRGFSRELWPVLLHVCRETRVEVMRLFYGQATFIAPSDPYTVPEWEARLPIDALKHLVAQLLSHPKGTGLDKLLEYFRREIVLLWMY
ncbi:hypothetical protein BDV96DRAFT_604850 [Lophiotrema nucula]|uniref:2EXR domain-containing protein n=1 Tax=Lophiotrema nucula TaxID=690887 RepID=A0A6A5YTS0_9PLEO|nr:hypothetical protein BDV96DRAFT_604850 [Lophiotrema nucula]